MEIETDKKGGCERAYKYGKCFIKKLRYKPQVVVGWFASVAKTSAVSNLGAKYVHIHM
jgi:hypothetical protein